MRYKRGGKEPDRGVHAALGPDNGGHQGLEAQEVERSTETRKVAGSTPAETTGVARPPVARSTPDQARPRASSDGVRRMPAVVRAVWQVAQRAKRGEHVNPMRIGGLAGSKTRIAHPARQSLNLAPACIAQWLERPVVSREVASSNLVVSAGLLGWGGPRHQGPDVVPSPIRRRSAPRRRPRRPRTGRHPTSSGPSGFGDVRPPSSVGQSSPFVRGRSPVRLRRWARAREAPRNLDPGG